MKKLLSTIFLSLVVSLFTTSLKADGHDFTIFNNSDRAFLAKDLREFKSIKF